MVAVLVIGTAIGVMWGALSSRNGDEQAADAQDEEQQQQEQQQQSTTTTTQQLQDNPAQHTRNIFRLSNAKVAAATIGGVACLAAAAAISIVWRQRRRHGRNKQHKSRHHADGRIPLKDLIRFKERQWFVEELENARDADPNAMVRLAKMYLNGQGCQQNIALAQEWVRKARNMGVPATLDELYATDDPDPHTKLRALAAIEERRRALRQLNSSTNKAGHKHVPQAAAAAAAPRPTAAA